jgi:CheR methyltransferase-like protein
MTPRHVIGSIVVGAVMVFGSLLAAARVTTLSEVDPILTRLADIVAPELKTGGTAARERAWNSWIIQHDRDIRERLRRGDADTLVNWLLFGTTFTDRPRALPAALAPDELMTLVSARAHDLVTALSMPMTDDRRAFARRLLESHGMRFVTAADRAEAERYLIADVTRVLTEWQHYTSELEQDRRLGDVSADLAARSKLFRDRGLSLDTSLPPCFALDETLARLKAQKVLGEGSVARVAIVGPGLDFSDKNAGYDFYPEQTVQPFMLLDSLGRLRMSPRAGTTVTTFDLSPRVNDHLARARRSAERGQPYALHLALDGSIPWKGAFLSYWQRAGGAVGTSNTEKPPEPLRPAVQSRRVQIRTDAVLRVTPEELNIVTQRDDAALFDLVVATNVLVYYDTLDQSLALANIAAMLKPGGVLLSNNAVLELPEIPIRSIGYTTVAYSDRRDDGDHILWYQRSK